MVIQIESVALKCTDCTKIRTIQDTYLKQP
jgi:hypothetical protein